MKAIYIKPTDTGVSDGVNALRRLHSLSVFVHEKRPEGRRQTPAVLWVKPNAELQDGVQRHRSMRHIVRVCAAEVTQHGTQGRLVRDHPAPAYISPASVVQTRRWSPQGAEAHQPCVFGLCDPLLDRFFARLWSSASKAAHSRPTRSIRSK